MISFHIPNGKLQLEIRKAHWRSRICFWEFQIQRKKRVAARLTSSEELACREHIFPIKVMRFSNDEVTNMIRTYCQRRYNFLQMIPRRTVSLPQIVGLMSLLYALTLILNLSGKWTRHIHMQKRFKIKINTYTMNSDVISFSICDAVQYDT